MTTSDEEDWTAGEHPDCIGVHPPTWAETQAIRNRFGAPDPDKLLQYVNDICSAHLTED